MITVDSYPVAVVLCFFTMLCWGSWANTQKLTGPNWPFQLFYWDYAIGVVVVALLLAFTLGSMGSYGRAFLADVARADSRWLISAFIGGVVFNLSNILLVGAIDIAGMALAFPVGVGLALVLGVVTTYVAKREGHVPLLAAGVACIVIAIALDAMAYRRLASAQRRTPGRGIVLSAAAGVLMGWFYSFVAQSLGAIDPHTHALESGKLSPYSALVLFSLGLFASNFLWNSLVMAKPFQGRPVRYRDYIDRGSVKVHAVGILGGMIWNIGMGLDILASGAAGSALSYGLGQGATLVGAIWGVFVWKEFRAAPAGTGRILAAMFVFYVVGLAVLVASKV
jgi:glucose uptake protein